MIAVVDCGMGNLGSIINMLKHIGAECRVISTSEEISVAEKIILPGVGNWNHGAERLVESGLKATLDEMVLVKKVPILGICLGMQLMADRSEEGSLPGLGWIPGEITKFREDVTDMGLRIPHMGWNRVHPCRQSRLTDQLPEDSRFYFVHSYHINCANAEHELLTCRHGYDFVCAVHRDNIWGVQFHPEKSHKFGMNLMKNFVEI